MPTVMKLIIVRNKILGWTAKLIIILQDFASRVVAKVCSVIARGIEYYVAPFSPFSHDNYKVQLP